jgi:hypothetical protein
MSPVPFPFGCFQKRNPTCFVENHAQTSFFVAEFVRIQPAQPNSHEFGYEYKVYDKANPNLFIGRSSS